MRCGCRTEEQGLVDGRRKLADGPNDGLSIIGLLNAQAELADLWPAKFVTETERLLIDSVTRLRSEGQPWLRAKILNSQSALPQIGTGSAAVAAAELPTAQ